MQHRSEKHDRITETDGPIRPGSPLYLAISQIAANMAKKFDEHGRHQTMRRHSRTGQRDENETASGNVDPT